MTRQYLLFILALVCAFAVRADTKDVPDWVKEVSSRELPSYSGRVPAAVVLEERRVTVDPSGLTTTVNREAVKILTHDGQKDAEAAEFYYAGARKVKEMRAWLVAPGGFVKTFPKNAVSDLGVMSETELYNEMRVKRIAADNPEVGAVFVSESEVEEKPPFAQDDFAFQENLPVVEARYVLTLPAGWTAKATVFNHSELQPIIDGTTYTWELKKLPFRYHEADGPSLRALAPRLAIDYRPASGAPPIGSAVFLSWADVSRWHYALSQGQDQVTPDLQSKVQELTTPAHSPYEKILAISRYVQNIKYVAIEMDFAHSGGYKPHAADLVFRKQYGDCKDKANLMRAMLKAAGIESYLVTIFSGDPTYVKQQWPSPTQFNHMIIAVRAPEDANAPAVEQTQELGSLLFFDPTSATTPLGDLPWYEQGSFALICAGDKGSILKMPTMPPETNSVDLNVTAELASDGALNASYTNTRTGQSADAVRGVILYRGAGEFQKEVQASLGQSAKAAVISKFTPTDDFGRNSLRLDVEFTSKPYAQIMQGRLMVFEPSILNAVADHLPEEAERRAPIELRARVYHKRVRIKLPPGFSVDEMPEPAHMSTAFAEFAVKFEKEADALAMDETLKTQSAILPPEQYGEVKKFFDNFAGSDAQKAVLVKN